MKCSIQVKKKLQSRNMTLFFGRDQNCSFYSPPKIWRAAKTENSSCFLFWSEWECIMPYNLFSYMDVKMNSYLILMCQIIVISTDFLGTHLEWWEWKLRKYYGSNMIYRKLLTVLLHIIFLLSFAHKDCCKLIFGSHIQFLPYTGSCFANTS